MQTALPLNLVVNHKGQTVPFCLSLLKYGSLVIASDSFVLSSLGTPQYLNCDSFACIIFGNRSTEMLRACAS